MDASVESQTSPVSENSAARRLSKSSPPILREAEPNQQVEESKGFQFINFTDFQQTRNPQTKKRVRSHVMHRVHQNMRTGERAERHGVIVLDISPLQSELPVQKSREAPPAPSTLLPNPSMLGAGRSNPFASYPIPMNTRTHELFDHLRGDFCPMFKTMSRIGFFGSMTDPAGFRQILCMSASHMEKLRAARIETSEAIILATQAIQSVNGRLADPASGISDGVIATILAFCCHDAISLTAAKIMFNDLQSSRVHFDGLEEIIRLRGGLDTLNSSPVLRIVLFWVDTNIAFTEDSPARFPPPYDLLPTIETQIPENTATRLSDACGSSSIAVAMRDLFSLNQLIRDQVKARDIWLDGVFAGLHIMPLLHKFLSIRFDPFRSDRESMTRFSYRAGAILYLAAMRAKFGVNLPADVHVRNLKEVVTCQDCDTIEEDLPVLMWLLVIGGTQSFMKVESEFFVSKLAEIICARGLLSWEDVMNHVRGVLWIEGFLREECERLRKAISTKVLILYGYAFQ